VWIRETGEFTPFHGFTRSLVETRPILERITSFPSNVFELFAEKSRAGFARMNGVSAYRVLVADHSRLEGLRLYPGNPFSVFISNDDTYDSVENYRRSSLFPLLHVTTSKSSNVINLTYFKPADLRDLFARVLSFLEASGEPEMVLLPQPSTPLAVWNPEPIELPELAHGVTIPNEIALSSLKFQLSAGKPLPAVVEGEGGYASAPANAAIIRALRESVEAVRAQRSRFASQHEGPPSGPFIDAIVWAAGVGSSLPESISKDVQLPDGLMPVLQALLRQRDYPVLTNQSPAGLREIYGSKEGRAALAVRKLELELCTTALGVMAAGYFAPVIRLRPAVNLLRGRLKQIAACATGASPRRSAKLSKVAHEIGKVLVQEIGEECMKLIEQSRERVKLLSNVPLELVPIQGLPLQLRFTTSRVPVTPGSVFLSHAIAGPDLYLAPSDLRSVLILRSFEDNDPIKHVLAVASERFLTAASEKLDVRVVDVRSSSEFVDAVNSFSGKILIYDGHGAHDERGGIGCLRLGSHDVHPLELAGKIRNMPPIVILSACSTHPLHWSEGSSATAFLMLGAVSILATFTPISARDAAVFTGRLLLRLADFVPMLAGTGHRWSDVITGLLRMAYTTDLIRSYAAVGKLSDEDHRAIQMEANVAINSGKTDWFENVLGAIANRSGMPLSDVREFWQHNAYFTSTLQYVHLGSPERIVLVEDDAEDSKL
jgi:hypothetical protein